MNSLPFIEKVRREVIRLKEIVEASGDVYCDISDADYDQLAETILDEYQRGKVGTVGEVIRDLFDSVGAEGFSVIGITFSEKLTAEQREALFRGELEALLKRHNAELEITDDGKDYGMHRGTVNITMASQYDKDGNVIKQFTSFRL